MRKEEEEASDDDDESIFLYAEKVSSLLCVSIYRN